MVGLFIDKLGKVLTVTVAVVVAEQLPALLAVIVYTVVELKFVAVTLFPLVALKPVAGVHV